MSRRLRWTCAVAFGCAMGVGVAATLHAADDELAKQLKRIPPLSLDQARAAMETLDGFEVQLVAAEPHVASPVAVAFDEAGRMFIAEMRDYSEQDKEMLGRIRPVEDTDNDGVYDKSTIYAQKLSWPTALCCWDGGVLVGAAPDVMYLKDTDGDGKADVQKVVYTGFRRSNVQGLLNCFQWGLDNRFHCATSTSGATVTSPVNPSMKPLSLSGRDFTIDPRTMEIRTISGGAQHGATFDDWGRRFVGSNSDHLQQIMYEDRYMQRNPNLVPPRPRITIAADGPQAEVFRISPVEQWRVIRTEWRKSGKSKGAVEGGGRAAGYFTGSTGVTIYRGDAWPQSMRNMVIVDDVGSNLVHRKVLEPAGVAFVGKRIDQGKEFVASRDIWFRPVQHINAPDGCMYIIDMARETIEHPASIPLEIKQHLDLTSGRDMGRIWRIAPPNYKHRKTPDLGKATTAELVALLEHPNAWHWETAARLLYQRQDKTAIEPLRRMVSSSASALGRLHALYALDGLGALTARDVLAALCDVEAPLREHAVRFAERFASEDSEIREKLYSMTVDGDMRVRYQLAFSLGEVKDPARLKALTAIVKTDGEDKWIRLAVLSSLSEGGDVLLGRLVSDPALLKTAGGRSLLSDLSRSIAGGGKAAEMNAAVKSMVKLSAKDPAGASAILRGLNAGMGRKRASLRQMLAKAGGPAAEKMLDDLLKQAKSTAVTAKASPTVRVEAVETLAMLPLEQTRELLVKLLEPREPQPVQNAALATLGSYADPAVGAMLVEVWPTLGPAIRSEVMETLFARTERLEAVLGAVEKGTLTAADLTPGRVIVLRNHRDAAIKARAEKALGAANTAPRARIVADYQKAMANLKGDAAKGKTMFAALCSACHKLEGVGNEIGPSLAQFAQRGADAMLLNVIDPNAEINPLFVAYIVTTKDGQTLTGMIAGETATSVTLNRGAGATDTILRSDIASMRSTGRSLMPEGLEAALPPQVMADLIAYLMTAK